MHSRHMNERVHRALRDTAVVLVHGARQTGKSTLVQMTCGSESHRRYLTLDDATVFAACKADPTGFLAGLAGPVALDEVQRVPELFVALKNEVDRQRKPGRYLLTGSANVLLLPRLSESLAGRIEIMTLWPLSQGELAGRRETFLARCFQSRAPAARLNVGPGTTSAHSFGENAPALKGPLPDTESGLFKRLLAGGFPEPLQRAAMRRGAWYESYLTTILLRDVRDLANIEDLTLLPRLLTLLAGRIGGLLNFADISRGLQIPQTTLKRYFALLETIFLVRLLPAWSANVGARVIKSPKLCLIDTGLASHLLGINPRRGSIDPRQRGALLENFVVMELTKQAGWSDNGVRFSHFRTVSGVGVDLVCENSAGKIVGLEVKAAHAAHGSDFNGLRALAEAAGDRFHRGIVLYAGREAVAFGKKMFALPMESLWA